MAKAKARRISSDHEDVQHGRASSVQTNRIPFEPSVGFDYDAVERGIGGIGDEDMDPRSTARPSPQDGSHGPNAADARTLAMMREMTIWLLYGQKADKIIPSATVKRLMVMAYAINPDLFLGKNLCDLAKEIHYTRESLYRFARDFTRRFGIPVVGSPAERIRLNSRKKWPKGAEHGQN